MPHRLPRLIVSAFALVAISFSAPAAFAAADAETLAEMAKDYAGASDHPLTGRYDGAKIVSQTVKAFDELTVPSGPAEGHDYDSDKHFSKTETLQGKVTRTLYVGPAGRSSLEIMTNHRDALAAKGFQPVFECAKAACGESFRVLKYRWDDKATRVIAEKISQKRGFLVDAMFDQSTDIRYALLKKGEAGQETWVALFVGLNEGGGFGDYSDSLKGRPGILVEVVEPKPLERKIVTIAAEEIGSTLASAGRISLYGIFFDFDKAELKPESGPQLAEMVRFLKAGAATKVFIVGHTDNKGGLDYNLALSGKRAEAVVKALAAQGIDPKRLVAKGLGPLAPLASNRGEDGQAKNRRVELVEQ